MTETIVNRSPRTAVDNVSSAAPLVTIGLLVFNGERYLREALESLLRQTFQDFELLISDNASTDGTAAICAEYAKRDPRIRYVRQASNIGVFPNAEFVIRNARGRYFMIAGDDDVYAPEYISTLLRFLERDSAVGLAYSNYGFIDSEGTTRKSSLSTFMKANDTPFRNARTFLRTQMVLPTMMGLYRTEVIQKALPFPFLGPSTGGVDVVFSMRMFTHMRVESTEKSLFHYREKDRSHVVPAEWQGGRFRRRWNVVKLNLRILTRHHLPEIWRGNFGCAEKVLLSLYAAYVFVAQYTLYPTAVAVRNRLIAFRTFGVEATTRNQKYSS